MSESEPELSIAEKIYAEIAEERQELKQNVMLTGLTLLGLLIGTYFQFTDAPVAMVVLAFLVAYLAGGVPAAKGAWEELRNKHLDIDLLMVLAALAAAGVGEARDGAILLFLFSLASTLEGYAMGNTKRAVASLMKLRPDEANLLLSDGTTERVRVENLTVGQSVIVKPGERIPIDGRITAGSGAIDQSSVTGESVQADKTPGDEVFAGTVNQNAVLTLKVTKNADQSTIARMIKLVTEAQEKRSPSESFSDWFGERYTYVVLFGSVAALIIFLLIGIPTDDAFYKAATLLVVASPCAIVISVPAAVLSAIAAAARTGVLFKGGAALEEFGSIDIVAFDKTGTLTNGKMEVTDVHTVSGHSSEEILKLAAAIEAHSEHPVATSIRKYTKSKNVESSEAKDTKAIPGKGIVATIDNKLYLAGNRKLLSDFQVNFSPETERALTELEENGKTAVLIADTNEVLGIIAVADTLRESTLAALKSIQAGGVKEIVMLTGDSRLVALSIAKKLGLAPENVYAELLPEDKVEIVRTLQKRGKVAFIGDGVNDAAALATSNVGIAMGAGGSDVALEAADIALLSDDLERLSHTYKLSKEANTIIRQNLYFAVGIMIIMVITTIFWYLPLPLGVVGHEGGTLLVVGNGLRLLFKHHKSGRAS